MTRSNPAKRTLVESALVEGNSIDSIVRITGVATPKILNLIEETGCACAAYHHRHVRGIKARRIHKTLRVTPAMEAEIADDDCSMEELGLILEQHEQVQAA